MNVSEMRVNGSKPQSSDQHHVAFYLAAVACGICLLLLGLNPKSGQDGTHSADAELGIWVMILVVPLAALLPWSVGMELSRRYLRLPPLYVSRLLGAVYAPFYWLCFRFGSDVVIVSGILAFPLLLAVGAGVWFRRAANR